MILSITKWIVILFGLFIIFIGFVMLFAPNKARATLRKAGSTNVINYTEITLRLIPAIALIIHSEASKIPEAFQLFGWIMVVTSLILYFIPRKAHHRFSMKSSDVLKPLYIRRIAPFAFILGGVILYNAL
ncbi:hypothetical protein N7U66_18585 [Lacinutrix neustonica]|uniref:Uncharacterized protein n=1 Tax=Lacinutrix neustonica TaxID=2980107 RepID=A0A9E8SGL4_9FLAO|nr:hypothetical protein [Lacinutrix neustonica]WAC01850.1 hypothetical protein N7U66_18585 [Lacinutrix neustonica]